MEDLGSILAIQQTDGWGLIVGLAFYIVFKEVKGLFDKGKYTVKNGNGRHSEYIKNFDDTAKNLSKIYDDLDRIYDKMNEGTKRIGFLEGQVDVILKKER